MCQKMTFYIFIYLIIITGFLRLLDTMLPAQRADHNFSYEKPSSHVGDLLVWHGVKESL